MRPASRRALRAIFQDWSVNAGDKKAQFILIAFRVTAALNRSQSTVARAALAKPAAMLYRVVVDWILGVEIPWQTSIGPNLRLHHARGIVINGEAVIGASVSIHQGVTIGGRRSGHDCPSIADKVRIGAGAIIIGATRIGESSNIGAGAVVLTSVPAHGSAVGNPARIIPPR